MRSDVIIRVVLTCVLTLGLFMAFAPYVSVNSRKVKQAAAAADIKLGMDEDYETYLMSVQELFYDHRLSGTRNVNMNAFQVMSEVSDADRHYDTFTVGDYTRLGLHKIKFFTYTALIITWLSALVGILLMWLLKGSKGGTWAIVCCSLSAAAILSFFLFPKAMQIHLVSYIADNQYAPDVYNLNKYASVFGWRLFIKSAGIGFRCSVSASVAGVILAVVCRICAVKEDNKYVVSTVRHVRNVGAITCERGMYAGSTLAVTSTPLIIGRDAKVSQLVIEKIGVSRMHCKIEFNLGSQNYTVTDNSSNGTFIVGGERLKKNIPTMVESGTRLQLGDEEDVFRLD